MNSNPVKVLDELAKGIVEIVYDLVHLTILALAMPLSVRAGKWGSTVKAVTKRLSAMTYLVIWVLLVVVSIGGHAAQFATTVIGLPSSPNDLDQESLPRWIAQVLIIAIVVDGFIRLACSRIANRARRVLYVNLGRMAIANIFIGMFAILAVEGFRLRGNWGALLGPLPALFWPWPVSYSYSIGVFLAPANPLLLVFAASLMIVVDRAVAIQDMKRRLLVQVMTLLIAPTVVLNATMTLLGVSYLILNGIAPSERLSLQQLSTRCTSSSEKVTVSAVLRLRGVNAAVVEPKAFKFMPTEGSMLITKDGNLIGSYGNADVAQPVVLLEREKPALVNIAFTLVPNIRNQVDIPVTFGCELRIANDGIKPLSSSMPIFEVD